MMLIILKVMWDHLRLGS